MRIIAFIKKLFSGVRIVIPNKNCLNWAVANKQDDERIVIGRYGPTPEVTHAWLENKQGECRDNMRHFDKNDERYSPWDAIDTTIPGVIERLVKENSATK